VAEQVYLDFDLLIERSEGGYRASVLRSPAGEASVDFRLPFSDLELENLILRLERTRQVVRRLESPEMETAKALGGRLFEAVFDGPVGNCFQSSLYEASRQEAGLRIRLRLAQVPELVNVPWEYLYDPHLNRFFSLSETTPLVRYFDLAERIRPLAVQPPLRILVMLSSPRDYPRLDVEQEWANLNKALDEPKKQGKVTLQRVDAATLAALEKYLGRGTYHVFHFIGHGTFDKQAQDGVLLLEDEAGRGRPVSGQYLGMLLHDERTLRLAILNACEGARTAVSDPFAGTAQSFVQQGIPAVIAMQFAIPDEAAIALAQGFYMALAEGSPVDMGLASARRKVFAQGYEVEWGTPVLYLRAPDGHIFHLDRPAEAEAVAIPAQATPAPPARAMWRARKPILFTMLATVLVLVAIAIGLLVRNIGTGEGKPSTSGLSLLVPVAIHVGSFDGCENTPNLEAEFSAALTDLLATGRVAATAEPDTLPGRESEGPAVHISGKCEAASITYGVELPTTGVDAESKIAEVKSLGLTWTQESVDVPARVVAAAVAYTEGDAEQAAAWLFETQQEWAQLDEPLQRASLRFLLGNAWLRHQEPSQGAALDQYEQALADAESAAGTQNPLIAELRNNRGRAYIDQEQFSKAVDELTLALTADPTYVWARLNRSEAYVEDDRFSEAQNDCSQAIRENGPLAPAYTCQAYAYRRQESWTDVLASAQKAVESDPEYAPAYYYLGIATCRLGDAQSAATLLEQALSLAHTSGLRSNAAIWLELVRTSEDACAGPTG
jgi:tetratricopeptide (TPR) repeat protein